MTEAMGDKVTFKGDLWSRGDVAYGPSGEHYLLVPASVGAGTYRVTLEPVEPELKPCPFCGADDVAILDIPQPHVFCQTCGAQINGFHTIHDAVSAWNARFP